MPIQYRTETLQPFRGETIVLDGLDEIDWVNLHHAYGSATDIPALLRALANPSAQERDNAIFELHGNLWHQGTVYEATAHAVPFLLQLAASPGTPDRHHILSYLGTLADGASYIDVHRHAVQFEPDELSEQLPKELKWVTDTRNAVKAGEAIYFDCLQAEGHVLCCSAAYALSQFPEEAHRYWPKLRSRFEGEENDALIRCGLAMLVGSFATEEETVGTWLRRTFASELCHPVRVALAVSVAHEREEKSPAALKFLAENMLGSQELDDAFAAQPWDTDEPSGYIADALCLSPVGRRIAVERFNELLSKQDGGERLEYCHYRLWTELNRDSTSGYTSGQMQLLELPD
jgi:hypothetical protein